MLNIYCQASGHGINNEKSFIYFIKGCLENIRQEIKGILQVPNETLNAKYPGMSSQVGFSKNGAFKYLTDCLWSKVQGWIEKNNVYDGKASFSESGGT